MTSTMPNGKTFLQNLDGLLTLQANWTLFKLAVKFILVIFFLGGPVMSAILFFTTTYANTAPQYQQLKQEFQVINSHRDDYSYLDYCEKIYELDEKWDTMIEETEGEDTFSYSPVWWLVIFPVGFILTMLYLHMGRHYWRTPFRIIHLPYLLLNGAFLARFFTSFDGTGLSNSVFALFAYNFTPGYYFWNVVNIVMFVVYILIYFVFMFGRQMPPSRKERCIQKLQHGESPLIDLLW